MKDLLRIERGLVAALLTFATCCAFPAWAVAPSLPRDSVYQLDVSLTDQAGHPFKLADHRGEPMLVSMFYTSCQFTCPLLVEAIRADEERLAAGERRHLKVLLVSFDPARDTTEVLRRTAEERHVDSTRWQLARTDAGSVRKVAALLDIQYKALDSGDFNHSTSIVLVDADGRIVGRTSDLTGADKAFEKLVKATLAKSGAASGSP